MGRKKPPGARRRGPSMAEPFDEFGNDPRAVMHRMANLKGIVGCLEEQSIAVMAEAHEYLERSEWFPPLGQYSLMAYGDAEMYDAGVCIITAYGLPGFVRWSLSDHLVRHEKAREWDVWDMVEVDQ